jgi:hypothetical protein
MEGGRAKFAGNLRASPFNNDLSNETTFSQIYRDGDWTFKFIKIWSSADKLFLYIYYAKRPFLPALLSCGSLFIMNLCCILEGIKRESQYTIYLLLVVFYRQTKNSCQNEYESAKKVRINA